MASFPGDDKSASILTPIVDVVEDPFLGLGINSPLPSPPGNAGLPFSPSAPGGTHRHCHSGLGAAQGRLDRGRGRCSDAAGAGEAVKMEPRGEDGDQRSTPPPPPPPHSSDIFITDFTSTLDASLDAFKLGATASGHAPSKSGAHPALKLGAVSSPNDDDKDAFKSDLARLLQNLETASSIRGADRADAPRARQSDVAGAASFAMSATPNLATSPFGLLTNLSDAASSKSEVGAVKMEIVENDAVSTVALDAGLESGVTNSASLPSIPEVVDMDVTTTTTATTRNPFGAGARDNQAGGQAIGQAGNPAGGPAGFGGRRASLSRYQVSMSEPFDQLVFSSVKREIQQACKLMGGIPCDPVKWNQNQTRQWIIYICKSNAGSSSTEVTTTSTLYNATGADLLRLAEDEAAFKAQIQPKKIAEKLYHQLTVWKYACRWATPRNSLVDQQQNNGGGAAAAAVSGGVAPQQDNAAAFQFPQSNNAAPSFLSSTSSDSSMMDIFSNDANQIDQKLQNLLDRNFNQSLSGSVNVHQPISASASLPNNSVFLSYGKVPQTEGRTDARTVARTTAGQSERIPRADPGSQYVIHNSDSKPPRYEVPSNAALTSPGAAMSPRHENRSTINRDSAIFDPSSSLSSSLSSSSVHLQFKSQSHVNLPALPNYTPMRTQGALNGSNSQHIEIKTEVSKFQSPDSDAGPNSPTHIGVTGAAQRGFLLPAPLSSNQRTFSLQNINNFKHNNLGPGPLPMAPLGPLRPLMDSSAPLQPQQQQQASPTQRQQQQQQQRRNLSSENYHETQRVAPHPSVTLNKTHPATISAPCITNLLAEHQQQQQHQQQHQQQRLAGLHAPRPPQQLPLPMAGNRANSLQSISSGFPTDSPVSADFSASKSMTSLTGFPAPDSLVAGGGVTDVNTFKSPDETIPGLCMDSIDEEEEEEDEDTGPTHSFGQKQTIHLWQFLRELLQYPGQYSNCIKWVDTKKGIFKIEDSVRVAKLWGERKNRPAMNYDKLSRSIRQYYKKGIIRKTDKSQRLVYQFCRPYINYERSKCL